MRIKWKQLSAAGALLSMALIVGGCGKEKNIPDETVDKAVNIPVVFLIDPATNLSNNQELVEEFNELYQGQYHIDVEWLTENAAGYRERLKKWNVLDEMPAIITDAGFDYDFYRMLVKHDRLVDLKPYMEEVPEWKDAMNPDILKECTEEDGSIYLSTLATGAQANAGIIYNKEYLAQAGYEEFPDTWDEFWACLHSLEKRGITPLSLHGSGSYWVPMLLATSYMEGSAEGKIFLQQNYPESYQNESMKELLEMMKRMYGYTYRDALEIDYAEAARRFCDGEAAVFANGYWMLSEMPEDVRKKMGFAPFPGNILMNSPRMTAWAVPAGYEPEVEKGAAKLLELRIKNDREMTEQLLNRKNLDPLEQDYVDAVRNAETLMPNYQLKWEQELQNDFFTQEMPGYLKGNLSAEEFLGMMDEKVKEIKEKK